MDCHAKLGSEVKILVTPPPENCFKPGFIQLIVGNSAGLQPQSSFVV